MSAITTHILDVSQGRPAKGVAIRLESKSGKDEWRTLGSGATDDDGRLRTLLPADKIIEAGTYRLVFETGAYFAARSLETFYPSVSVTFTVARAGEHYHVPLLVSPFGYSTYRGS